MEIVGGTHELHLFTSVNKTHPFHFETVNEMLRVECVEKYMLYIPFEVTQIVYIRNE